MLPNPQSSFINDGSAIRNRCPRVPRGRWQGHCFAGERVDLKAQRVGVSGCESQGPASTGVWVSWPLILCSARVPEESQQVLLPQSCRVTSALPICSRGSMGSKGSLSESETQLRTIHDCSLQPHFQSWKNIRNTYTCVKNPAITG